jgi:hypothetical protein
MTSKVQGSKVQTQLWVVQTVQPFNRCAPFKTDDRFSRIPRAKIDAIMRWAVWINLSGLTIFVTGMILSIWRFSQDDAPHWPGVALLIIGFIVQLVSVFL